jgi:hypothetical protein
MTEPSDTQTSAATARATGASVQAAIRSSALGLLIGGAICLYFGLTLIADAPGSVSQEEAERWFATDRALFWCLRGTGLLFLISAVLAWIGRRVSMLLATIADVVFALLMLAMAVEWTLEARVDGGWDATVILLLILAFIAAGAARRSWDLYRRAGLRSPAGEPGSEATR